jgi:hypothetical protein
MSNVKIIKSERHERPLNDRRDWKDYRKAPRIYIWVKNYNPINDIFTGERYDKPYKNIRPMLPDVLRELGINPEGLRFRWSRYAGCSCPCSPGFIVSGYVPKSGDDYFDIHIEYEYVPTEATAKA